MKINLEIDSSCREDMLLLACFGKISETYYKCVQCKEEESEEDEQQSENEPEVDPSIEEPKDDEPIREEPQPEKPKRTRKKKEAKVEPVQEQPANVEAPQQNPEAVESEVVQEAEAANEASNEEAESLVQASEQPLVAEVQMPLDEGTINREEWSNLLLEKRKELQILTPNGEYTGAPNAYAKDDFNTFVKKHCEPYGCEKPGSLSDEARYKFYHEVFKHIQYEPTKGFYLGEPMPIDQPPY